MGRWADNPVKLKNTHHWSWPCTDKAVSSKAQIPIHIGTYLLQEIFTWNIDTEEVSLLQLEQL